MVKIKHTLAVLCLSVLCTLSALAVPAKPGSVWVTQPDGSTFMVRLVGDEFQHLMLTSSGSAVTKSADGWYCYQLIDENGVRTNSGVRVGPQADESVVAASRMIPYAKIAELASEKRALLPTQEKNLMRRFAENKQIELSAPATKSSLPSTKHGIIILAAFQDLAFTYTRDDFVNLLTQSGYSVNGATGSAKEYFEAQFDGSVEFIFDVSEIVTVSQTQAYYGANNSSGDDQAPEEMVVEAVQLVDASIDFSQYDDDGDGYVDNVFVFFAGADEAEYGGDDCIWSHAWSLVYGAGYNGSKTVRADGKIIDSYACTSELTATSYTSDRYGNISGSNYVMAGIGTFCHEYSHTLGLPDLYDTNYETDGQSDGLWGTTSLMDSGSYNNDGNTPPYYNAIEREIIGLSVPEELYSGEITLEPISTSNRCFKVDSSNEGEYYLIECRMNTDWDKYIGGKGLLVYHIDKSSNQVSVEGRTYSASYLWDDLNSANANSSHPCADILEANPSADGKYESRAYSGASYADIFYPYSSYRSITTETTQKLSFWNGEVAEVSIDNITISGSNVTMTVIADGSEIPPTVKSASITRFQDAAIVTFQASRAFEGDAIVRYGKSGLTDKTRIDLTTYESGYAAAVLEGLTPTTSYEVQLSFAIDGVEGTQQVSKFMTLSASDYDYPYISFRDVLRTSSGVFPSGTKIPLRIGGITDYEGVTWYFDGEEISVGADCYYTLTKSGELKADVVYSDGSHEILAKIVTVN